MCSEICHQLISRTRTWTNGRTIGAKEANEAQEGADSAEMVDLGGEEEVGCARRVRVTR